MISDLFTSVLRMSLSASWMLAAVLLLRLLARPAPKRWACLLWCLFFIRLLCPTLPESAASLIPRRLAGAGTLSVSVESRIKWDGTSESGAVYDNRIRDSLALPSSGNLPAEVIETRERRAGKAVTAAEVGAERMKNLPAPAAFLSLLGWLWLAGALYLALKGLWSYEKLRRKVRAGQKAPAGIFESPMFSSAFVFGFFHPVICLPADLGAEERDYILRHERIHARRGDNFLKLLACAATAIHWFNPLAWLACRLFVRDLEMSCDEGVLEDCRTRGSKDARAAYSRVILAAAAKKSGLRLPVSFGEHEITRRIRHIGGYSSPARWAGGLGAALCLLAFVCLLTDPLPPSREPAELYAVPLGQPLAWPEIPDDAWRAASQRERIILPMTEGLNRSARIISLDERHIFYLVKQIPTEEYVEERTYLLRYERESGSARLLREFRKYSDGEIGLAGAADGAVVYQLYIEDQERKALWPVKFSAFYRLDPEGGEELIAYYDGPAAAAARAGDGYLAWLSPGWLVSLTEDGGISREPEEYPETRPRLYDIAAGKELPAPGTGTGDEAAEGSVLSINGIGQGWVSYTPCPQERRLYSYAYGKGRDRVFEFPNFQSARIGAFQTNENYALWRGEAGRIYLYFLKTNQLYALESGEFYDKAELRGDRLWLHRLSPPESPGLVRPVTFCYDLTRWGEAGTLLEWPYYAEAAVSEDNELYTARKQKDGLEIIIYSS